MALLAIAAAVLLAPRTEPAENTCLAFVTSNLAKGTGNFFEYYTFANKRVGIKAGDVLVYSIFIDAKSPEPKGGIDINFEDDGAPLRDIGITDDQGIRAHGDGPLPKAMGKWLTRRIPLDAAKGRFTRDWVIQEEGDAFGRYVQFLDDIYIQHADGLKEFIYQDGGPQGGGVSGVSGYTAYPGCLAVNRDEVKEGVDLTPLILDLEKTAERLRALEEARKDIDLAEKFLKKNPDPALQGHIIEARAMIDKVSRRDATPDEIQAALHAAQHALSHTHPVMEKYTGHLVGHAHIDLQWLWEWQEGIAFSRDTFRQAAKFMDEFPGFTFSQSSSALYEAMEDHYPEIFNAIKKKVKNGQWELVGGRVCEGDTNLISPESHARQFLYGQRYFRERFGKTAIVGWEPDTFGHALSMPQILKLGGCKYYYFCRGGKEKPLFWWEGIDGTRVLAFDEPASGSWYNSDLSYKQFQEILDFQDKTGSKDALWVYGVGNHGGGPTREYINEALKWMKSGTKPNVKFSTATQFFKKLETYDLTKIPVIDQELNPVFDGCYTTHSEIKQANRNAEAWTTSAEVAASLASAWGFKYPHATFRKNWESISFNHHHDTLPGSGIHSPYDRTLVDLGRVIAEDRDISVKALESIAVHCKPSGKGVDYLVFNPTGWTRSGWVEGYLVQSGGGRPDASKFVSAGPDGKEYPLVRLEWPSNKVRFYAGDVPPFGYKVFNLREGSKKASPVKYENDSVIETERYRIEIDRADGCLGKVFDKKLNRDLVAPGSGWGRMEAHYENPGGMSAWVMGDIKRVEVLKPTKTTVDQNGDEVRVRFDYVLKASSPLSQDSPIYQTFTIRNGADLIESEVHCNWKAVGTSTTQNPTLRVAVDSAATKPIARHDIPFGWIVRPTDGREFPALEWVDVSDANGGVALLNDSKHGYSVAGSTMRLSLIRSSFDPDPEPNPGNHVWRYAILPHPASMAPSEIARRAVEFNQPMMVSSVPYEADGLAPNTYGFINEPAKGLVPTVLKLAEDRDGWIVRMYEADGKAFDSALTPNATFGKANWVNFLEDNLGDVKPSDGKLPLQLHRFEIRTVKLKRAATK